jgi:hypothetical protein
MADNLVFRLVQGESGATLTATLKENDVAVNFTTENIVSVDVIARSSPTATPVLDEPCTIVTAASGVISYAFDGTTSDIAGSQAGKDYLLQFKATDAAGDFHYFPKQDGRRAYGVLRVFKSL